MALLERKSVSLWKSASSATAAERSGLSSTATSVFGDLSDYGASFFEQVAERTALLRTQLEQALAELVCAGLVTADSASGLRALLVSNQQDRRRRGRRRNRVNFNGMDEAGRWSVIHRDEPTRSERDSGAERIALILLKRYGVVFRRLMERETLLPPWRDLLIIYRKMEARGEVRGGRFVAGYTGEQFALPEAVGELRQVRRSDKDGELISVSATDPANLVGILTGGQKLPALSNNRVLYRDGLPVAVMQGGEVQFLEKADVREEWLLKSALQRKRNTNSSTAGIEASSD
jgi:ATP-dependent Lhr-like helicase